MKDELLIDLQLFPGINYCNALFNYSNIIFEQYESYVKTGFSNRYEILMPPGPHKLSVPLAGGRDRKMIIKDVRIANSERWQQQHRRSLQTAYGRAPFYEFYAPILEPVFAKQYDFLIDLQLDAFDLIFRLLRKKPSYSLSESYQKTLPSSIVDRRHSIGRTDEILIKYPQVFEERIGFTANLSILDLLFCVGPQAFQFLSIKV